MPKIALDIENGVYSVDDAIYIFTGNLPYTEQQTCNDENFCEGSDSEQ